MAARIDLSRASTTSTWTLIGAGAGSGRGGGVVAIASSRFFSSSLRA
jgi:hypothetical protein